MIVIDIGHPTVAVWTCKSGKGIMRRHGLSVIVALALITGGCAVRAEDSARGESLPLPDLPDVAQPQIDDPISGAELEDLRTVANQKGMSLQAAIDRYAWNDNFALAVSKIRDASPGALSRVEIVDGGRAWISFAAGAPERAMDIIDAFEESHGAVTVEVRTGLGFTEDQLEKAIATVHDAVFEAADVRDASTSFDFDTRQITTVVALDSGVADSVLDDLRASATEALIESGLGGILDSVAVSVVRSNLPTLGGH